MATLQWVGGGDNQTSDTNDWIDTSTALHAAPAKGDTLTASSPPPGPVQSFTMNVRGNDLMGSPLSAYYSDLTANLSHRATMTAYVGFTGTAEFNVSQHSTLNLGLSHATATVNLSQNSTLYYNPGYGTGTINVSGRDTLAIAEDSSPGGVVVNLQPGARLVGTFVSPLFELSMNGAENSVFLNNGASFIKTYSTRLNVEVAGNGSMTVSPSAGINSRDHLEFVKAVGSHQSVLDGGVVQIDSPNQFRAGVTLATAFSEVDLLNLVTADSYTFKNDLLKIFSGNNVIDTLRLTDQTPYGFDVVKTAGSVNVVAHSSSGATTPGALPVHTHASV